MCWFLTLPVTLWVAFAVAEGSILGLSSSAYHRGLTPRTTSVNIFSLSPQSTPISMVSATSTSISSLPNALVSTVSGSWVSLDLSIVGATPVTVPYSSEALLTGSCTDPYFALYTAPNEAIMCAQIGCSNAREGCCAVNAHQNAVFTRCPVGYISTAAGAVSGCCPSGWTIYFNGFNGQTPCYTHLSTTLVPGSTPAITDLTVITGLLFAKKLELAATSPNSSAISVSRHSKHPNSVAIAVPVVVISLLLLAGAFLLFWRRKQKSTFEAGSERPTIDHKVPQDNPAKMTECAHDPAPDYVFAEAGTADRQELESPDIVSRSQLTSMPTTYELQAQPASDMDTAKHGLNSPIRGFSFYQGSEELSLSRPDEKDLPSTRQSPTAD